MIDKLKYIKLELEDGSYSEPIPISAEAEYVDTSDGDSVEEKLNKKPYYFNNVAQMKSNNKLKSGDLVTTLGYYAVNDDGNASYLVRNKTQSDVQDNGSIHFLNNNLVAELIVKNDTINYIQFGAKLDGITDDTISVVNAHNYANKYNLKVTQKKGILYIPSANINNCPIINTDCDFTGLKIKFNSNSDNKTVMIIADPNTLTNGKNDIQSINLSSSQISALSKSNIDPIPFLENFKNNYVIFETDMKAGHRRFAGEEDIYYSQGFEVNDLQQLTPNNMYADISQYANEVTMKYLPLNQRHITIKLPEININGNVNNNPMIIVMRNNVELLDCIITKTNYEAYTQWKQPLFRCKYCCNLVIRNWVGQNVSNEPTNTDITSYIVAIDECFNVLYENNNLLKAHGCFVSYHTNFMNFINNICDRFDSHYGLFGNINIVNNSFISFPAVINLGYGDGNVNILNNAFYKYDENGKEFSEDCIIHRTDLTCMYAGNINVDNTYVEAKSLAQDKYVTLLQYISSKNENSIFPNFANYNIPNISIKNTNFNTNVFERTMRVYNNIDNDVTLTLRNINLDNPKLSKNTSTLNFGNVNVASNTSISLNNEKINMDSTESNLVINIKDNTNYTSNNSNINTICYVEGNNNNVYGKFKNLTNKGVNTIYGNITNTLDNYGTINAGSNSITCADLNSYGKINSTGDITVTNAFINNYLKCKNLTSGTKTAIIGAFVEITNSVTNNGEVYLTGNYMYSTVAARFNNGTINGNGNWAGVNSNIINTLS